jgi:hypothetical protein
MTYSHQHLQEQLKNKYENIYNSLKEYMFYPNIIQRNMNAEFVSMRGGLNDKRSSPSDKNSGLNGKQSSDNHSSPCDKQSSDNHSSPSDKHSSPSDKHSSDKHSSDKQSGHKDKQSSTRNNKDMSSTFFTPQEKDKLFWCLYIFLHGEYEYMIAKNNSFSIEKKCKMEMLEKINEKDVLDFIKKNKMKKADLEDEFMTKDKLSLKGLQLFCMIYKLSVLYVSGRTYCEFAYNIDDDQKTFVIVKTENKEHAIYRLADTDTSYVKNIRDTYWKLENVNKPLNGVSAYTLQDLQTICSKLEIKLDDTETKKKKTKNVLYQEILSKL